MPKITYIEHSGEEHQVEVALGFSVMEGAIRNNVPGILAECGGACACATCHVYITTEWMGRMSEASEMETSMLEYAEHVRPESRLSCQIKVTAELEGLTVRLPESQG